MGSHMIADLAYPDAGTFTPDELVRDLKHLPSAPKILPRLKQLLCDSNSSMHEIVELIRFDPAIAARVLQVGNSAYYSKGVRCFTVNEAVNRVGYQQVYELVSYAVASQVLVRPLDIYQIEADELWRRSVACGLAAEMIATQTGQDRDVAYTVGLLHSLGMVAIDSWSLRHRPGLKLTSDGLPLEAVDSERKNFGFTQADVGAALLQHWEFPHSMCEPVRWQYSPRACAAHTRMACLLHCAKWLRSTVCGEGTIPPPAEAITQMVPLRFSELSALATKVSRRLDEISTSLDIGRPMVPTIPRFPSFEFAR